MIFVCFYPFYFFVAQKSLAAVRKKVSMLTDEDFEDVDESTYDRDARRMSRRQTIRSYRTGTTETEESYHELPPLRTTDPDWDMYEDETKARSPSP